MKIFFVAYSFGSYHGQVLIGVYKRSLRIARELHRRGHEIVMFCTGRGAYQDELIRQSEEYVHYMDIPFSVASFEAANENRRIFMEQITAINPDLVVIGEVPLAGAMLEATLCAAELGKPVVILDNAYNPLFAEHFCEVYGPIADGIILTGPTSYHAKKSIPYLCQVPPYIESSPSDARKIVQNKLGLSGDRLIAVLGYDSKVEGIGISLLKKLDDPGVEFLFLSRQPEKCRHRLEKLPGSFQKRARVIAQPVDQLLFGFIEIARLAVVKYGFMQVSECLALRTPVAAVYYEGPQWLNFLPQQCRPFTISTSKKTAGKTMLRAVKSFLNIKPGDMSHIHDGSFGAAGKAADFLEKLPLKPRLLEVEEFQKLGITESVLLAALSSRHNLPVSRLETVRAMELRKLPEFRLFSVVCGYRLEDETHFARLWYRNYSSKDEAERNLREEFLTDQRRKVYFFSADDQVLVEKDAGQELLPPL